ncbi:hypothetical protein KCP73_18895 [Salmonella enterica subsp. enterica]|nr:hypothetical protein KCP73_18895 [Salmonella enterica subsp. enterica]
MSIRAFPDNPLVSYHCDSACVRGFALPCNVRLTLAESARLVIDPKSGRVFTGSFGITGGLLGMREASYKCVVFSSGKFQHQRNSLLRSLQYLQSALYRRSAIAIHSARCASANNFITCDNSYSDNRYGNTDDAPVISIVYGIPAIPHTQSGNASSGSRFLLPTVTAA